jgi:hypothetical protein
VKAAEERNAIEEAENHEAILKLRRTNPRDQSTGFKLAGVEARKKIDS